MKNEIWIGKKGFRYWYYHFRDSEFYSYSMTGLAFVVCALLLINWIIPELNSWFSIRDEVTATQGRVDILQRNIAFMNNLNENTLNQQLQVVTQALPEDKNFQAILNEISTASIMSGVSLNQYSFQVGSVSSSSTTPHPIVPVAVNTATANGLLSIAVTVTVNGSIDKVRRFILAIEEGFPLAEVTGVNGNGQSVGITIQFYQKPFPKNTLSLETPIAPLSSGETALLGKLSKWQSSPTKVQGIPSPISSTSAIPLF